MQDIIENLKYYFELRLY